MRKSAPLGALAVGSAVASAALALPASTGRPVRFVGRPDAAPIGALARRLGGLLARPDEVAGALRDLGYAPPEAANDTVYENTRLTCQGQIRFGASGRATAAAL